MCGDISLGPFCLFQFTKHEAFKKIVFRERCKGFVSIANLALGQGSRAEFRFDRKRLVTMRSRSGVQGLNAAKTNGYRNAPRFWVGRASTHHHAQGLRKVSGENQGGGWTTIITGIALGLAAGSMVAFWFTI
jgi:hypothetical protein